MAQIQAIRERDRAEEELTRASQLVKDDDCTENREVLRVRQVDLEEKMESLHTIQISLQQSKAELKQYILDNELANAPSLASGMTSRVALIGITISAACVAAALTLYGPTPIEGRSTLLRVALLGLFGTIAGILYFSPEFLALKLDARDYRLSRDEPKSRLIDWEQAIQITSMTILTIQWILLICAWGLLVWFLREGARF